MFTKKLKTEANIFIQFSYVLIVFVLRSQCREYGMRRPPPLTCALGHAVAFAMNGALVASQ